MDSSSLKDIAIEKIAALPKDEVVKVLIFMAGLDAGIRINTPQAMERGETA